MGDIQVRRLPVLNREKRLVGIIALGDIAMVQGHHQRGIERDFTARRAARADSSRRRLVPRHAGTSTSTQSRTNEANAVARRRRHSRMRPAATGCGPELFLFGAGCGYCPCWKCSRTNRTSFFRQRFRSSFPFSCSCVWSCFWWRLGRHFLRSMRRGPAASVRTRPPSTEAGRRRKPGWFSSWGTPLIEATLQPAVPRRVPTRTREPPSSRREYRRYGLLPPELLIGRDGLVGQHQPPSLATTHHQLDRVAEKAASQHCIAQLAGAVEIVPGDFNRTIDQQGQRFASCATSSHF